MPKTENFEKFVRKELLKGRKPKIASCIWSLSVLAVLVLLVLKR